MPPPLTVRKFESFDEWINRPRSSRDSTGPMPREESFRASEVWGRVALGPWGERGLHAWFLEAWVGGRLGAPTAPPGRQSYSGLSSA